MTTSTNKFRVGERVTHNKHGAGSVIGHAYVTPLAVCVQFDAHPGGWCKTIQVSKLQKEGA